MAPVEGALTAAKRFVHSVVMVDDKAFAQTAATEVSDDVKTPGRAGIGEEKGASPSAPVATASSGGAPAAAEEVSGDLPGADSLDAERLIKTFAKEGLVCAVIAPAKNEDVAVETAAAARRSDVVVVDWVIHDDHGETASKVVQAILKLDREAGGRLRLIVVYTGEPDLRAVMKKLRPRLEEVMGTGTQTESELKLAWPSVAVVVLAKEHAPIPEGDKDLASHVVPEATLPRRLIEEFSELTSGLLCAVAVFSLAEVREQTHSLIANLGAHIDPAFLAHRALLLQPAEATEYALDLVADEIGSLVQAGEVDAICGDAAVRERVSRMGHDPKAALQALGWTPVDKGGAADLAVMGLASKATDDEKREKAARKLDAGVYSENPAAARASEMAFAVAATLLRRKSGSKSMPQLTLGTILRRVAQVKGRAEYLVCIQPRCDCVRLGTMERSFLFLTATPNEQSHHLILDDAGTARRLRLRDKPQDVEAIPFAPTDKGMVRATLAKEAGKPEALLFASGGAGGEKFAWVGQLKASHAQRLANRFAAQTARVGLNEPEWLRIRAGS